MSIFEAVMFWGMMVVAAGILGAIAVLGDKFAERRSRPHHKHA